LWVVSKLAESDNGGKTNDVKVIISASWVNMVAHIFLAITTKSNAENLNMKLKEMPTVAASFAFFGWLAPNSFPTLVDIQKLKEHGKMWINAVVSIKIPTLNKLKCSLEWLISGDLSSH
jgi:hypothetical protein